ncbi:hypothetical protein FFLO_00638 [Filobasidium floriforme]|uniref:tRNA-dihydrouridine(47) synthase [NAD(P)(+)] n=1 Tax=Filobasidium floriforme TaxID=5210 RepID=A0A8K0JR67_9TREE|nr:hypothetical protein FFLO_00638 [Filobasidium floriforme]
MSTAEQKTGLPVSRPGAGIASIKAEYRIYQDRQSAQEKQEGASVSGLPSFLSGGPSAAPAESSNKRAREDFQDGEAEAANDANDDDAAEAGGAIKKQRGEDGRSGFKKMTKAEKKAKSGQNKGRKFKNMKDEIFVCSLIARGEHCDFGDSCKRSHDLEGYFKNKPKDIRLVRGLEELKSEPPFVIDASTSSTEPSQDDQTSDVARTLDTSTTCPLFSIFGYCEHGWKCRFLGAHVKPILTSETKSTTGSVLGGYTLVVDEEKKAKALASGKHVELNDVSGAWQKDIRKFPFAKTIPYLRENDPESVDKLPGQNQRNKQDSNQNKQKVAPTPRPAFLTEDMDEEALANAGEEQATGLAAHVPMSHAKPVAADDEEEALNDKTEPELAKMTGAEVDKDDVPIRAVEKRRLDWRGKTYLAPLTTVGNLPFRRLCVDYGADITCGEMAMGNAIVNGAKQEWSLTRRHPSEKNFGIQLCGGKQGYMVPAAEIVKEYCNDREGSGLDFVDINLGCPIDLVFQRGAGSALFDRPGQLGKILVGMNKMLGEIPLTVKFRTGIKQDKNVAHKFIPRFATEWGISAMTLHGRSRQQRYSKMADWSYIKQCAETLRETCVDAGLPAPPIFGNGDCFSAQSYYEEKENSGVDGIMVARGALIKPWIFTEIQERREWDISATERLDGMRKFAEYGLTHWGTDTQGVNTTRRFLCEAMSFQHRYVPIGLLERMPPQINERPPAYRGRNELETLLASGDSRDWVKITEMFLGKVPDSFNFVPKHKSNAYNNEDQG